jgi:hypothetical protein
MVMGGTADTLSASPADAAVLGGRPTPKFLVKIEGGTHDGFRPDSDSAARSRQQDRQARGGVSSSTSPGEVRQALDG